MNIYLFKRDPEEVEYDEYAGFVVRAQNEDKAIELIGDNYNLEYEGGNFNHEHYTYDFTITLIASGVIGEPEVLLTDYKAG